MPGAVAGAVETIGDYLVGRDARRVEQIWSSMYYMWHNVRGGVVYMSAMSGIDIALWDIKARAAGLPYLRDAGRADPDAAALLPGDRRGEHGRVGAERQRRRGRRLDRDEVRPAVDGRVLPVAGASLKRPSPGSGPCGRRWGRTWTSWWRPTAG